MNISQFRAYLQQQADWMKEVGVTKVPEELSSICTVLNLFGEHPLPKFCEFLQKAAEYYQSGALPGQSHLNLPGILAFRRFLGRF